ncbi:MAG: aspartyl protease family protein [Flavobacteriaceae bacterium]|jgi:hypothetical protein|nr:aspartyl protease family protein [Flavobacteriaceae bacterium]
MNLGSIYPSLEKKNIPFEYNQYLLMDVEIDSKKFKFVFDTNANISVLSPRILESIKYSKTNGTRVLNTSSGKIRFGAVHIDEFAMGDIIFKDFVFAIPQKELFLFNSDYGIDGIIGYNIINKFKNFKINYQTQTIEINTTPIVSPDYIFDFIQEEPKIVISLDTFIDGTAMTRKNYGIINVDTGVPMGLSLSKDKKINAITVNEAKYLLRNGKGVDLWGSISNIQDKNLHKIDIDYASRPEQGSPLFISFLGNDFLDDYVSFFDLENNQMLLVKTEKRYYFNDFYFYKTDGKFIVTAVKEGSFYADEGLKPGSEIIAIDGLKLSNDNTMFDVFKKLDYESNIIIEFLENGEKKVIRANYKN